MEDVDPQLPSFFRLAKNVSKHSEHRYKIGAVLVNGGRVISVGFNKCKFNSVYSYPDRLSIHAEAQCIKTSGRESARGAILFVYREDRFGMPATSKPCDYCMSLLKEVGIKKVLYTTDEYPYFEVLKI